MMVVFVEKGVKDKLNIQRIDVNNADKLPRQTNGMKIHLNDMIYLFNDKKLICYGCLRSYFENVRGSKMIALFNPRFPANPKFQPERFGKGIQIKQVDIKSATGIIKVHLDPSGQIKSYEKFGMIPKKLEMAFLQECGYTADLK
jgi:CRISPR-associated endonuclease Csn1